MLEKLLNIQSKLKCPKTQINSFGNYNYRSCEDILDAVKPLLKEQNMVLILSDEVVNIGSRYYVKATARLFDIDSKDEFSNTAYAREEETKKGADGSQITGASSSYARKYALNGLFAIDDGVDSDTTNKGDMASKSSQQATKTQNTTTNPQKTETASKPVYSGLHCEQCDEDVSDKVAKYSKDKFGKVLCYNCQKTPNKELTPVNDDSLPF